MSAKLKSGRRLPRSVAALLLFLAAGVCGWLLLLLLAGQPVLLWTDCLIFVLLAVVVVGAAHSSAHEHLRLPWRRVRRSRLGVCSGIILAIYILIGVLDSVHYRPRQTRAGGSEQLGEVRSVFDRLMFLSTASCFDCAPGEKLPKSMREWVEKTYSAPLALHLHLKESIELPDGSTRRGYPRLKYGGGHLKHPEQRSADVLQRLFKGAAAGLAAALLCTLLLAGLLLRRAELKRSGLRAVLRMIVRGETDTPWNAALFTLSLVLIAGGCSAALMPEYHVLGTDKVGQDVFYQALKSVRTGLVIGTLTTLIMLPFAVLLGIAAGYFGGWVDDIIQYLYTTLNSIPGVLLIAAAVLMLQVYIANHGQELDTVERADLRLLFLCIILGITSWTGLCRLLRGESLKLREANYIQAARALGVGNAPIILRHILPNVMHLVLIAIVLDFSGLVLAEAVLSYVGVGVDPTMDSWGNMINRARLEMAREPVVWWSLSAAFVFMFILVLAANLFSDQIRDAFDPRLREKI